MRINAFKGNGKFYKGNLHCHTTVSDGKLSPEDTAAAYKAKGYDFLAITDHRTFNTDTSFGGDELLIIPGMELDGNFQKEFQGESMWACHHIVVVDPGEGFPGKPFEHGEKFDSVKDPDCKVVYNGMKDIFKDRRCVAIYAHPKWSRVSYEDLADLEGFFAMEIYNGACYFWGNIAESDYHLDMMLRNGKSVNAVASDDNHHTYQIGQGWICVKADALTQKDIMTNIIEGNYYSSSGPEIKDIYVEDNKVHVECSPCRAIHMARFNYPGRSVVSFDDELLTHAEFDLGEIKPNQPLLYIRIECEDERGKKAWSNPIKF